MRVLADGRAGRRPGSEAEEAKMTEAKKRSNTDSKFDRMIVEEKVRWLESRGAQGGSLAEFSAHIRTLVETDEAWKDAHIEALAGHLVDAYKAGRLPKRWPRPRPIKASDDTRLVHINAATVRDFLAHADLMQKQAKTKAARAEADAAMMAAETAMERAGGNLDAPLRDVSDEVWPARETRQ
jgi:hypothetical protein